MVKLVKLNAEARNILQEQKVRFLKKFGREPGPNDPVFFDEDAETPQKLDEKKFENATLAALLQAGTRPEIIYAYRKTGFLVNEVGYKNMRRADRAEYNASIDEYFNLESARRQSKNS